MVAPGPAYVCPMTAADALPAAYRPGIGERIVVDATVGDDRRPALADCVVTKSSRCAAGHGPVQRERLRR